MTEQSLHEQLKEYYAMETGDVESVLGDYRVDVIRGDLLIEIQTRSFYSIRDKLAQLVKEHHVRLVHPVPFLKWVVRLDRNEKQVGKRRSPKKGRVEIGNFLKKDDYIFISLVIYMSHLGAVSIHSECKLS